MERSVLLALCAIGVAQADTIAPLLVETAGVNCAIQSSVSECDYAYPARLHDDVRWTSTQQGRVEYLSIHQIGGYFMNPGVAPEADSWTISEQNAGVPSRRFTLQATDPLPRPDLPGWIGHVGVPVPFRSDVEPIAEPLTIALIGTGLTSIGLYRRSRVYANQTPRDKTRAHRQPTNPLLPLRTPLLAESTCGKLANCASASTPRNPARSRMPRSKPMNSAPIPFRSSPPVHAYGRPASPIRETSVSSR